MDVDCSAAENFGKVVRQNVANSNTWIFQFKKGQVPSSSNACDIPISPLIALFKSINVAYILVVRFVIRSISCSSTTSFGVGTSSFMNFKSSSGI